LLPMCLENLDEAEWFAIAEGSDEIGWCLVVPEATWTPAGMESRAKASAAEGDRIKLPTGSFTAGQLEAILNSIPFDVTFVDADDTVRYFSHGRERIFARTKAIIGRKVQYCHPPKSVSMVEQILDDFRSGRQQHAQFWITMGGRFICIEYFALKDDAGAYLGCLEVSQDLTAKRALGGEQRLLNYVSGGAGHE
ncbi:MAG TPA: PAS domain-containing protein, partial [Candidatus Krumholzibacteria bacterium]|nr:PAS domain-containing protein [Candidatus Krumholzibacteria bacterium]